MATLKASTEQIRLWNEQRKAELAQSIAHEMAQAQERRKAIGKPPVPEAIQNRIIAAKVSLEIQANPREYREQISVREASNMEIAPTPERVANGGLELQYVYNTQGLPDRRVYRPKSPVEQYRDLWPTEVYNAFKAYEQDAQAEDGPPITIDYNRNGGSSLGKLGGLGNVHERTRDAYERFHWVRDRLTRRSKIILDYLILGKSRNATGRPMTIQEVGSRLLPTIKTEASRKWWCMGRLEGAGDELEKLYWLHNVISREPRPHLKLVKDEGDGR